MLKTKLGGVVFGGLFLSISVCSAHAACSETVNSHSPSTTQAAATEQAEPAEPSPVQAQVQNGQVSTSPEKVVQEMVNNAEEVPGGTGEEYVEGQPAKPIENWFGCKPGDMKCLSERQKADLRNGDKQGEAATSNAQTALSSTAKGNAGNCGDKADSAAAG